MANEAIVLALDSQRSARSKLADAYDRAIGLAEDPAAREFLPKKRG